MNDDEDGKTDRIVRSVIKQDAMRREQIGDHELRKSMAEARTAEVLYWSTLWGAANAMGLTATGERAKANIEAMGRRQ
jgi:hypothetical protein